MEIFKTESETPYDPEFVSKIREASKNVENGEFVEIDPKKGLWESIL